MKVNLILVFIFLILFSNFVFANSALVCKKEYTTNKWQGNEYAQCNPNKCGEDHYVRCLKTKETVRYGWVKWDRYFLQEVCSNEYSVGCSANPKCDVGDMLLSKHGCSASGCIFDCSGKECGDNGCGGVCGPAIASCDYGPWGTCDNIKGTKTCSENSYGVCILPEDPMEILCKGKQCGSDGCGGICGPATATCYVDFGTCEIKGTKTCSGNSYESCVAVDPRIGYCSNRECGPDPCGGSCGTCASGERCVGGVCGESCGNKQCGKDAFGLSCGDCDLYGGCDSGTCVINRKKMSMYTNKELFLVSDGDWREVLPWISATTWTGKEENCQRGYGTAENVCVYPFLIYHDETTPFHVPEPLTSNIYQQSNPSIYGYNTVFNEYKDYNWQISLYNSLTKKVSEVTSSSMDRSLNPKIFGSKIVWNEIKGEDLGKNLRSALYMCDLNLNGRVGGCLAGDVKTELASSIERGYKFAMDNDNVVWANNFRIGGNSYSDVYLYNFDTKSKKRIVSNLDVISSIKISGNKIIWSVTDYMPFPGYEKTNKIYMYDINTNQINVISDYNYVWPFERGIDISQNKIIWKDYRRTGNWDIFMCDLNSFSGNIYDWCNTLAPKGGLRQITSNTAAQTNLEIHDNKIVWQDSRNGNWDIYTCDLNLDGNEGGCLANDAKTQLTYNKATQENPSIYEDKIVWQDERDTEYRGRIYSYDSSGDFVNHYGFDIDSPTYFMQQYDPSRVKIIGETSFWLDNLLTTDYPFGVGLREESVKKLSTDNYLGYWDYYNTIVYVEDDYELALLASTYASLKNAPLIIRGSSLDVYDSFTGKNVICVGDVSKLCAEKYNLKQLQQKYFHLTNTNKFIVVNPDDFTNWVPEFLFTEKSGGVKKLYSKMSLAAPILASAKHELITFSTDVWPNTVDVQDYKEYVNLDDSKYDYLTIIASPLDIPIKEEVYTPISLIMYELSGDHVYWARDPTTYADLDGDALPDVGVGRIQGLTVSDTSSYIARSLFYNIVEGGSKENIVYLASHAPVYIDQVIQWATDFRNAGYNSQAVTSEYLGYIFSKYDWKEKGLVHYLDHGLPWWAGIYSKNLPLLDNSLVFVDACLTCSETTDSSFCDQAIRKGAMAYVGNVGISFGNEIMTDGMTRSIYIGNNPIGKAFSENFYSNDFAGMITLLGDPTFKLNSSPKLTSLTKKNPYCKMSNWGNILLYSQTNPDLFAYCTGGFGDLSSAWPF